MADDLDQQMEQASAALARMDYVDAESRCLAALQAARAAGDWRYYARILMPLQEARRQRRMIAAEGVIRLGTAQLSGSAADWLAEVEAGCFVLTHPHTAAEARALQDESRRRRRYIEVLFADNAPDAGQWTLRAFVGPMVTCAREAPPADWRDVWVRLADADAAARGGGGAMTAADWFIDATEALGDAAIAQVDADAPLGDRRRVEALEQMLDVVTDHELLHQRLGDAARAMVGGHERMGPQSGETTKTQGHQGKEK